MKSEHRHELQQNELGKLARKVKPWLEKHGFQVAGGLLAVLVVAAGAIWWTSGAIQAGSAGWTKLSIAESTEDFAAVAEKESEHLAGAWARLRSAELNLENGILETFTDRELALTDLKRAKEDFEKVLASKVALPPAVEERARLGLARCLEATSDGDVSPAVEAYQALLTKYPDSIYKKHVEQRIKELRSDEARDFYAWFHSQKPKPPDFRKPQDNLQPTTPADGALPPAATTPTTNEPQGESTSPDAPK